MPAGIKANNDGSGAIQVGGTDVIGLGTAGQWGIGGANYGTAGQVLTSAGSSAAPTWSSVAGFPTGTAMMFVQTAAPTGWTKSTTHDNKALRVVSGTASSGGSVAFTTAFASQAVSGTNTSFTATNQGTTLAITQIPAHGHSRIGVGGANNSGYANSPFTAGSGFGTPVAVNSANQGGGTSHTHTQDAHTHTFTGTAINLAVQYVDVIIATKD